MGFSRLSFHVPLGPSLALRVIIELDDATVDQRTDEFHADDGALRVGGIAELAGVFRSLVCQADAALSPSSKSFFAGLEKTEQKTLDSEPDQLTYKSPKVLEGHLLDDFGVTYLFLLDGKELMVNGTVVDRVDPLFLTPQARLYVPESDGGAMDVLKALVTSWARYFVDENHRSYAPGEGHRSCDGGPR